MCSAPEYQDRYRTSATWNPSPQETSLDVLRTEISRSLQDVHDLESKPPGDVSGCAPDRSIKISTGRA